MKIFKALVFVLGTTFIAVGCKPQQAAPAAETPTTDSGMVGIEAVPTPSVRVVKQDSAFTVVSVDRTKKTVYRGIKNPLTIVVPGAVSTKVEGSGVMKASNYGHYDIRPGQGTKAEIKITAVMPDGSTYSDTRYLNIKNLPNPKSFLDGVVSSSATALVLTEEQLKQAQVSLMMVDFEYELEFIVTGFDVLFPNGKKIKVEGNKLNDKALEMLKKVKHNGQIKIQNIVAHRSEQNAGIFRPEAIVVKVNKKAHSKK